MAIQRWRFTVLAALLCALSASCSRKTTLEPYPPITDPLVFSDGFGANVHFEAFQGSKLDGLSIDSETKYQGTASMKLIVPAPGDPTGGYTGGALLTSRARNLSGYNALTFFVKASRPVTLDVAGLGNNNSGTSRLTAQRSAIPVTTSWTQVYIPIPLPARLDSEPGLFFFAQGPQSGAGLTLWIDEVRFVNTASVTNARPILSPLSLSALTGTTISLTGATRTTFSVSGVDQSVAHMPGYFTIESSNPAVAFVDDRGIRVLAPGTCTLTAKLGTISATGAISLAAAAPPIVAAPTPTLPASDVKSLFSNAYANVPVDTWSSTWDQTDVADISIAGNAAKVYTNMVVAGIEFTSRPIDASGMTHFHIDVWTPGGTTLKVKLVDFGADATYGGLDDSESELTFNAASTPPLATNAWVGLDIPLENFTALAEKAHVAQLLLSGDTRTVFVDNVYFHK